MELPPPFLFEGNKKIYRTVCTTKKFPDENQNDGETKKRGTREKREWGNKKIERKTSIVREYK